MATSQLQKIGKYDITEVLGEGGMGIVYKAVDPGIGRPVAIKMMTGNFADNPDLLKRFQREAQSAGTLQHRNIVIIYELGTENGHPYMAMEYLSGESLEHIVSTRKRMSLVEKTEIMIQVLEGENAIAKNRDLMGATDPRQAAAGSIRADFAASIEANAVHGSDGTETARMEIAYFFPTLEIHAR